MNIYKFKYVSTITHGASTTHTALFREALNCEYIAKNPLEAMLQIAIKMSESLSINAINCNSRKITENLYAACLPSKTRLGELCEVYYEGYAIKYEDLINQTRTQKQIMHDINLLTAINGHADSSLEISELYEILSSGYRIKTSKTRIIKSLNRFKQSGYVNYDESSGLWIFRG